MRAFIFILALLGLAPVTASAIQVNGDLVLRDAIYLYSQDISAKGSKSLVGNNCDLFQLVLKVDSGYTDLAMLESTTTANTATSTFNTYPDRIQSSASMFAYALGSDKAVKTYQFQDTTNLASNTAVGTATIFGYCFSTKSDAYVYFQEQDKCSRKLSSGSIQTISACTPAAITPVPTTPTPASVDLSALVGTSDFVTFKGTRTGSGCATPGAFVTAGQASVTASGNSATVSFWNAAEYDTFALQYQSGDSSSGYSFAGTYQVAGTGISGTASMLSMKRTTSVLGKSDYTGYVTMTSGGCTTSGTLGFSI